MFLIILNIVTLFKFGDLTRSESFKRLTGTNEIDNSLLYLELNLIPSDILCATLCINNDQCSSFGYHSDNSKCQFISSVLTEQMVEGSDSGWSYFVKAEHCITPWVYYGGSCYYIKHDTVKFDNAKTQCSDLQSHLIKIDDDEENSFAQNLVKEHGSNHHWIGLSDADQEGKWLWYPSLAEVVYTGWSGNEPGGGTGENCAVISSGDQSWHDYSCTGLFSLICEKES